MFEERPRALMKIDRAAVPFVAGALVPAAVLAATRRYGWASGFLALGAFFTYFFRDPDRVMRLRHPAFHTITPDGTVSNREQMYERTRMFIARVERFDSLSEMISGLVLAGDTAHAIVDQRTVRQQRFPDRSLHEVRTSVVQRESWIRTAQGWLLWRVDQIQPGETLVDGQPRQ